MKSKPKRSDGLVYSTNPSPIDWGSEPEKADAKPGGRQVAVVRLERKGRGGKSVTIIEFRSVAGEDVQEMSRRLKTVCGVGGTTKDNIAELQGDQRDKVRPFLLGMGIMVKG